LTTIDFYFNAEDRFQVACRLAAKALAQKKRLLIYVPEAEAASRIDKLLWTWPAIGFVPHCAPHDPLAAETPVLVSSDADTPGTCELLLNLGGECPPHFGRFERLLEVVATDEAERQAARARYRFYQARGYKIMSHDLARDAE
jgi:DNA polymerase-3 subunit chi